jgi:hypothetical protein
MSVINSWSGVVYHLLWALISLVQSLMHFLGDIYSVCFTGLVFSFHNPLRTNHHHPIRLLLYPPLFMLITSNITLSPIIIVSLNLIHQMIGFQLQSDQLAEYPSPLN